MGWILTATKKRSELYLCLKTLASVFCKLGYFSLSIELFVRYAYFLVELRYFEGDILPLKSSNKEYKSTQMLIKEVFPTIKHALESIIKGEKPKCESKSAVVSSFFSKIDSNDLKTEYKLEADSFINSEYCLRSLDFREFCEEKLIELQKDVLFEIEEVVEPEMPLEFTNIDILYNLGKVLLKEGDLTRSLACLKEFKHLIKFLYCKRVRDAGNNSTERDKQFMRDYSRVCWYLGVCYLKEKNEAKAVKKFKKVIPSFLKGRKRTIYSQIVASFQEKGTILELKSLTSTI